MMERLLSKKAVREQIGFSFAHIARMVKEEKLPQPVRIGHRVFWAESEVQDWIRDHLARR